MDHPELESIRHEGEQLAHNFESRLVLFTAWLLECKMRVLVIALAVGAPCLFIGYAIGKHHWH